MANGFDKNKPQITAVITDKRKKILSIGRNSYVKTHRWMAELAAKAGYPDRIYLHAEVDAIIRCRDLSKAHAIKTFRYNAAGLPVNAKPCAICWSAIEQTPIKIVEYT